MQSGSLLAALAIAPNLGVQSSPFRVFSVTPPLSTRIWMRYPSNLISWTHSPPAGGRSTERHNCGAMKEGIFGSEAFFHFLAAFLLGDRLLRTATGRDRFGAADARASAR